MSAGRRDGPRGGGRRGGLGARGWSSRSSRKDKPRRVCPFRRTAWHPAGAGRGLGRTRTSELGMERPVTTQELRDTERTHAAAVGCATPGSRSAARPGARPLPARADARRRRLRRRVARARRAAPARRRRQGDPARARATAGVTRAEREAQAAARLNHPGVVGLYELDHDEHSTYLVSELVRGRTFAELAQRGRAVRQRRRPHRARAVRRARPRARARGDPPRREAPERDGPRRARRRRGFAKLADFGVAHLRTGDVLTRTGDVVGTLAYMAPEQAEGLRVTPAADVYSLALMLYEGWTGVNPVRGHGPAGDGAAPRPPPARVSPTAAATCPTSSATRSTPASSPNPARRPPHRRAAPRAGGRRAATVRRGRPRRAGDPRPLRPHERDGPNPRPAARGSRAAPFRRGSRPGSRPAR